MKTNILFAFSLILILGSCGNNPSQNNSKEEEKTDEMPEAMLPDDSPLLTMELNTVLDIEDWIAEFVIEMEEGQNFEMSPSKNITVGERKWEASVLNPKGRVSMVRGATPSWVVAEEAVRYFTRDGHVVVFEEIIKGEDQFIIDRVYYANGEMIEANTRKGNTLDEAMEAVPGEFEPQPGDVFDDYETIRSLSDEILAIFHNEAQQ